MVAAGRAGAEAELRLTDWSQCAAGQNCFRVSDPSRAMVGTEATCGLVLEAGCKLIDSPQHRSLVLVGYEDCPTPALCPLLNRIGPKP